jgi:hypothetical protein
MEKAVSQNPEVRNFFSSLSGIPTFFSRSPQRLSVLDFVSKKFQEFPTLDGILTPES